MIEQWIEGVELAVSVIGHRLGRACAASGGNRSQAWVYDTAAAWTRAWSTYYAPVRNESLSSNEADAQAIRAEIERAVLEVYRAYGLRDLGRIDLIWDGAPGACDGDERVPGHDGDFAVPRGLQGGRLSLSAVLNELVSNAKERGAVFC